MNKPQAFARLARDARLVQEAQLAFLRARGFEGPSHVTEAARELAASLKWPGSWIGGHDKQGMVFVNADDANVSDTCFQVA